MKINKVNMVFWILIAYNVYFIIPNYIISKLSVFFKVNKAISLFFGFAYLSVFAYKTWNLEKFYKENDLLKYDNIET